MQKIIPMFPGLSLRIATNPSRGDDYPTARLQKGFQLIHDDEELAEEAVGFGVPVLKRGFQTVFPGEIELTSLRRGSIWEIVASFKMNLEEKITKPGSGSVRSKPFYTLKNSFAALHRHLPLIRGVLTASSNALRWIFDWETIFEDIRFCTNVKVVYTIDSQTGKVNVEVDTTGLPRDCITEVIMMNEQGANYFDRYRDSNGTCLRGREIGSWDEVTAKEATFISDTHHLSFSLEQVKGARLFRGRELVGSRLAWSGFGYSFPPTIERFCYTVRIDKFP